MQPSFTAAPEGVQTAFPGLFFCPDDSFTQIQRCFAQVSMTFALKSCIIRAEAKGRNFYGGSIHPQHKYHTPAHVCNKSTQTCNTPLELVPNLKRYRLYSSQKFTCIHGFS